MGMANDGEIKIGTKIDESGLDKGLKSVKGKVNNAAKDMNKGAKAVSSFTQKMGGIATSGVAAAAGIAGAVVAAKKFIDTMKEANEAYKVQEKAEKALQKAAENNPYLNGESVRKLKDYASELQGVSNYGDEVTIQLMSQLAASGRTEAEIMKIMGAAADVAASGVMSLDSAVKYLNSSYNGLAGELGERIPQVKTLTAEEMKQGKAVEIVAKQYKGMAKAMADSGIQAKNAFGDFMEIVGGWLNKAITPIENAVTIIITKINDAITRARKLEQDAQETAHSAVKGTEYEETTLEERLDAAKNESKEEAKAAKAAEREKAVARKAAVEVARAEANTVLAELYDLEQHADETYYEYEKRVKKVKKEWQAIVNEFRSITIDPTLNPEFSSGEITYDEARIKEYEKAIKMIAELRIEDEDTLRRILTVEGVLDETTGGMVKTVEEFTEELEKGLENAEEMNKEEQKWNEEKQKQQAAQKKADDYAEESNRKLQESLYALEVEAKAKGEAVSAQAKYNVYLQSYIDLLTKTEGAIREGYPIEQKRLGQLQEARKAVDEAADAERKLAAAIELTQEAADALNSANRNLTPAGELKEGLKRLDEIKAKIKAMSEEEIAAAQAGEDTQLSKAELIAGLNEAERQATLATVNEIAATEQSWWSKYRSQQQELLEMKRAIDESEVLSEEEKIEAMEALNRKYMESRKQQFAELATEIKGYTDQMVSVMQDAANLMLETVQNQSTAEQAELRLKYLKGEMGEEEYNEKITESKKKAAKEQYKIQMFEWSASILQATANIAQGVTKAIAQGGVAGIVTGAIVALAGATQIASIVASKPTPPSFATGGIVPGNSYSGDRVQANVNSGEMILNAAQQRSLWEAANGRGAGGGANIVINNSASNVVRAQPQITKDKIEILIDARVNESLKSGRYNASLNQAQQGMGGDYYGI